MIKRKVKVIDMRYYVVDKRTGEVVNEKNINTTFMSPETYYEYACSGNFHDERSLVCWR